MRAAHAEAAAVAASLHASWQAAGHSVETSETPPSIVAMKVLTPVVNVARPPATPAVRIEYRTKNGFGSVQLGFYSPSSAQSFTILYTAPPGTSLPKNGSLVIEDPAKALSLYAASGSWSVGATIVDQAGYEGYGPAPENFQVVNTVGEDVTPPTILSGQILTPTVSVSSAYPAFQTSLQVSDDLSGVQAVYLNVRPYGVRSDPTIFRSLSPHRIIRPGTFLASGSFSGAGNEGSETWIIEEIDIVDFAGNAKEYTGDAVTSIFGTNMFTVTQ